MTPVAGVPPQPRGGLRRALAFSSSGTAGARVAGAVGGLLAARLLGPTGRGQLAILVFVGTALAMATAAGIQFWIARQVAVTGGVSAVSRVALLHSALVVGITVVVGLVVMNPVESLADVGPVAVWVMVAFAATSTLQLLALALPNGLRAMGILAVAVIVAGVVYVMTVVGLLAVDRDSIPLVLGGAILGNLISMAIAVVWARRAPKGAGSTVDRHEYAQALRFGLPAGLGELVLLAMLRVDVLIVAAFLPLRDVGLYAVATALAELLWVVPDGVAQVVLPTTAQDPGRSRTPRLIQLTLVLTALFGVVLVATSRFVFGVAFGADFEGAASAVPFLVVASLGGAVWKIAGAEIVARGRTQPRLTSALCGLVVMVLVDLVVVPSWGIVGAAFGSACAYLVAAGVVVRAWSRHCDRPSLQLLGLARADSEVYEDGLDVGAHVPASEAG